MSDDLKLANLLLESLLDAMVSVGAPNIHDAKALILALRANDLALVPAADMPTPEERAVLEAMAAVPDIAIDMTLDLRDDLSIQETRVWEAELARRAAKEAT